MKYWLVGAILILSSQLFAQEIKFSGHVQTTGSFNFTDYKEINLVTVNNDQKHKVIKSALEKTLQLYKIKINPKAKNLVSIRVMDDFQVIDGTMDVVPLVIIKAISLDDPTKRFEGLYRIVETSDRAATKFHAILGAQHLIFGKRQDKPYIQKVGIDKKAVRELTSYYGK